jgi:tetratricopeptide (TPR) repeat protein
MRKPLPPLHAFAEDLRHATARDAVLDDAAVHWLSVAQTAEHLAALSDAERPDAIARAARLLAVAPDARPTMHHDVLAAPSDPLERLAEQLRVEAEAMERSGCFHLAFTTVASACRLTAAAHYASATLATVHLGRIARQLNDLDTASDCYDSSIAVSMRERDAPLAARGFIGRALIQDMRGNLPAAEREYLEALKHAAPMRSAYADANQGLMTIAIFAQRFADALLYGWQAYDATTDNLDKRTAVLSDLAVIALRTGFPEAAIAGFEHALSTHTSARVRLVVLGGAIRAAATLARARQVEVYDVDIQRTAAATSAFHDEAQVLLYAAEAWTLLDEFERATQRLDAARSLADRYGFHQYRVQADVVEAALKARARGVDRLDPTTATIASDPRIASGVRRLALVGR